MITGELSGSGGWPPGTLATNSPAASGVWRPLGRLVRYTVTRNFFYARRTASTERTYVQSVNTCGVAALRYRVL